MIKEKRRKQRLMKKLLIAFAVFVLLTVIAVFVVVKVFVVKNVKIEGNELYEEQLITDTVLNDKYSWNSLYVLLKYTFKKTDAVPFIDAMEIELEGPQTLKIKVYEKGIMGYLYIPGIGENAYFDKDGFVVETSTRIIEGVPKIEGVSCDEVVLYEQLSIDKQKLREMLTLTQALKSVGINLDAIDFDEDHSPVLHYGKTQVWMGSVEFLTEKVGILEATRAGKDGVGGWQGICGIIHMEGWTEESKSFILEKLPDEPEEEVNTDTEVDSEDENSSQDDGQEGEKEDETPQDDVSDGEN